MEKTHLKAHSSATFSGFGTSACKFGLQVRLVQSDFIFGL